VLQYNYLWYFFIGIIKWYYGFDSRHLHHIKAGESIYFSEFLSFSCQNTLRNCTEWSFSGLMNAGTTNRLKSYEFPKGSGIRVREIINFHDGENFDGSFLVTVPAKLTGTIRKRKQFKDRNQAKDWASHEFLGFRKQGEEYFNATDEEKRQIAHCLPTLREHGISITEATEFAIQRLRPKGGERSLNEVVSELTESKRVRFERGDLRERSYRDFRHRARRFTEVFDEMPVKEVTSSQIKEWLLGLELSPRTTQNYLAVLSEILKFATQRKYLFESPVDEFTDVDRKELCGNARFKEPSILTVEDSERLLIAACEHPELELLGAVVLGLFCGIRTEELKRLDWSNVKDHEDNPIVTITSDIAKKRRIRNVDIPENANFWLSLCPKRKGSVARNLHSNDYQKRFRRLLRVAGFGYVDENAAWRSNWDANAMRHSFGTYHYALHGNPLETARLLGHKASDQVLFDHYRALASREDGERFFATHPPKSGKVLKILNG
jgi:integrase